MRHFFLNLLKIVKWTNFRTEMMSNISAPTAEMQLVSLSLSLQSVFVMCTRCQCQFVHFSARCEAQAFYSSKYK